MVNLISPKEIFIKDTGDYPFFSPDDLYINIGGATYCTDNGNRVFNPFYFNIPKNLSKFDTYDVAVKDSIMAVRYKSKKSPLQIREYKNPQLLATINNNYAARAYNFAFTKNNLVLYSDTGIITIYRF
ncbi:MAG: hypothetical protein ACI4D3_05975 [Lachnospiraceae bacterium]